MSDSGKMALAIVYVTESSILTDEVPQNKWKNTLTKHLKAWNRLKSKSI